MCFPKIFFLSLMCCSASEANNYISPLWLCILLIFLNWSRLWTRKEKEIAVVSHSGFLFHTLSTFGNDCHPNLKNEICTQ
jgi:hypothetical protein